MSWGIKYRIEYKRISDGTTTIDILQKSYTGSIIDLQPDGDPLQTSFSGDVSNIYYPTIGTGATINILAIPLTLLEFFTSDPQEFITNVYHGTSGSTLVWQGFINSEIYNENYSYSTDIDVPIQIQCNDGMAILDTLFYKQSDGSLYTGTQTKGDVLTTILSKLGVTFTNVYTSNDLTTDGSDHNLFLNLLVNNDNYIDESGVAMTCREVLDSIFGGLGLVMRFKAGDIYIYDPINLHDTSKGKAYDLATFTESTSALGGYLDISNNDVKWYDDSDVLDIVPIVNEVDVNYDPYTITDIAYDFNNIFNLTSPGSWSDQTGWFYNTSPAFSGWSQSAGTHFIGVKEKTFDDPVYALFLTNTTDTMTLTLTVPSAYQDTTLGLKISMDSFFQTKVNSANIFSTGAANDIYAYYVQFSIMLGNQYWKDDHWETGATGNYKQLLAVRDWVISDGQYVADNTSSQVGDRWATARINYSMTLDSSLTGGPLTFIIYDFFDSGMSTRANSAPIYAILLKNLKIDFVDLLSGKIIENSGVLTKGNLSTNLIYKTNITTINTTSGTGTYGVSRGTFMNTSSQKISGLYRDSDGTIHDTALLILQSFISQYKVPRAKLTGVLDANIDVLKLIKDTDYLPGKAFYIVSCTYDDCNESASVEMIEITSNREAIT